MKQKTTFESADWHFDDPHPIWKIDEEEPYSYPYLVNNEQIPHPGL